jgi:hypothetical protein
MTFICLCGCTDRQCHCRILIRVTVCKPFEYLVGWIDVQYVVFGVIGYIHHEDKQGEGRVTKLIEILNGM